MSVYKSQIKDEIEKQKKAIEQEIANGLYIPSDTKPAIYIGRISRRKYHIGWNLQDKNTQVGHFAILPHIEPYIETPTIAWVSQP